MGGIGESVHADARAALAARDPAEVVRLLTPWLGEHVDDSVAWTLLAAAHFDLGDWQGLRDAATQTVRLLPGSPSAWCNLGMALRKLGRLPEAREALERARDLDPSRRRTAQELAKVIRAVRGMDGSPSPPSTIPAPERPDAAAASPTPRPRGIAAPSPSSIAPVGVSRGVPAGMPNHRDVRADLGGPQCSSDHGGGTEGEEEEVETWRPFDPPDPETPGTEFAEADEAEPEVPPGVRTDGAFPYGCIECGKALDEPLPDSCPGCGASLSGGEAVPPGEEASSSDDTPEGVVLVSDPGGPSLYECRYCSWPLGSPPLPDRCSHCGRRLRDGTEAAPATAPVTDVPAPTHPASQPEPQAPEPEPQPSGGRGSSMALFLEGVRDSISDNIAVVIGVVVFSVIFLYCWVDVPRAERLRWLHLVLAVLLGAVVIGLAVWLVRQRRRASTAGAWRGWGVQRVRTIGYRKWLAAGAVAVICLALLYDRQIPAWVTRRAFVKLTTADDYESRQGGGRSPRRAWGCPHADRPVLPPRGSNTTGVDQRSQLGADRCGEAGQRRCLGPVGQDRQVRRGNGNAPRRPAPRHQWHQEHRGHQELSPPARGLASDRRGHRRSRDHHREILILPNPSWACPGQLGGLAQHNR